MLSGTSLSPDLGWKALRNVLTDQSMTLVGLLPPSCDNGSMLVDGGYSR